MNGVRFADGFDRPEKIAFGLGAPQLAVVASAALLVYLLLHAGGPAMVRLPLAVAVAATSAVLAWGRIAERPMLSWALLATRFAVAPRRGAGVVAIVGRGDGGAVGTPASGGGTRRSEPDDHGDPSEVDGAPWARWLRPRREAQPASTSDDGDQLLPDVGTPEAPPCAVEDVEPAVTPEPPEQGPGRHPRTESGRDGATVVEIARPPLVLLPEPLGSHDLDDTPDTSADSDLGAVGGDATDESTVIELPRTFDEGRGILEVAEAFPLTRDPMPQLMSNASIGQAPVFLGSSHRIAFFSLNGGSGRTALATEVACLLAARGVVRSPDGERDRRLRVVLLDLDLRSPNVAVRLGIPHPTILDYLVDGDAATLDRFLVQHSSGVRALLGPPKPLSTAGAVLEHHRLADVLERLERDGTHIVVIDLAADLGPVSEWALDCVQVIYIVIRASASGIQDAYRSTEVLRRLGHGHKLRYVVNRARGRLDMTEVMADLGGRVITTIPDDHRVEVAENAHRSLALEDSGPASSAIQELAADVYPSLRTGRRRRVPLLGRLHGR